MILGQVSWLDCFIFLIFLAPQLIIEVGFFTTLITGLKALPFLLVKLPLGFIYDRFFLSKPNRPRFVQQASWFEDIVIRCVRYAFTYIPASIGRVFFSKPVSLPFLRFRMLRHGYFQSPIHWHEINRRDFNAVWMIKDKHQPPDIIIYYAHGGGFSMGSPYFYLEFLLAFLTLLSSPAVGGYNNPAILALEYTLVPDSSYPTQIQQALAGYSYLLSLVPSSRIVFSGDSAGGAIILSTLLHLASAKKSDLPAQALESMRVPAMAVLISPWVTLISPFDQNTRSDYLDANSLHRYARQYADRLSVSDPLISPGNCKDVKLWREASPEKGFFVMFGREEVFAPEIRRLLGLWKGGAVRGEWREEGGGIHAWPVASLFLSSTKEERLKGLKILVGRIRGCVGRESMG